MSKEMVAATLAAAEIGKKTGEQSKETIYNCYVEWQNFLVQKVKEAKKALEEKNRLTPEEKHQQRSLTGYSGKKR